MACCGGVVGQVLNGATDTVNKVVNTALENPLQTAALVAAAVYAPELLASTGAESAGAEFGTDALWNAQAASDAGAALAPASTTSSILNAGNSNLLGNFSVSSPNFETFGANDLLSSGIVSPTSLAPSMVDASGNIIAGSGAIGGATMAPSMADIMANPALPVGVIDMTAASGLDAAKLASAAAALKNANSLLNPSSSGSGGSSSGGSSFAQPSGLSGGVSSKAVGTGSDQTSAYNENLKMMGGYTTPIQSVNTSGMVPSYKSMSSPTYARGGDVHGHPEYPRSPLETVFSTRGGSNYVQGKGTGQSDDIDAKLADGEYVFDADIVSALGDGSNKAGAQALDKMREAIRAHKRSAPDNKIPPKAKSTLAYLQEGNK